MPIVLHAVAGASNPAPRRGEPRDRNAVARRASPLYGVASWFRAQGAWLRAHAVWILMTACLGLSAHAAPPAGAGPGNSPYAQAREIETYFLGYPKRAQEELSALLARADASPAFERRYVYVLYGQAIA